MKTSTNIQDFHSTVAVTGASGFLGSKVVAALRRDNFDVLPYSRRSGSELIQVEEYSDIIKADILIHLAQDSDRHSVNKKGDAYSTKVLRTLDCLLNTSFNRVIYASSTILYGDALTDFHNTDAPVCVVDNYSKGKFESERKVLARTGGVVLRFTNIYGPGMSPNNVINRIISQIPGEGELRVWDGSPVRDFLWIEDAAAAVVQAAKSMADGLLNIASGTSHSVLEVAEMCLQLAGENDRKILETKPSKRESCIRLSIQNTLEAIRWRPRTSLEKGLETLITQKLTTR